MRIPTKRIYRAFPELDRFDNERCEAFMRSALQKRPMQRWGMALASCLLGIGVYMALTAGVIWLGNLLGLPMDRWDGSESLTSLIASEILRIAVPIGGGCVAGLLLSDWWLRRRISTYLIDLRCRSCRYTLLGLLAKDGAVRCPECGAQHSLAELGVSAAELERGVER